jgi:putative nucleotidyltransferase with HDIG domain
MSSMNLERVAHHERHRHEGHGRRLIMAFETLEAFPALAESRERLLWVLEGNRAPGMIAAAVESDVALTIAVLRLANQSADAGRIDTALKAVEALGRERMLAFAEGIATFDLFAPTQGWDAAPAHFRLHAVATQRAAERIATELHHAGRERLMLSSLLHDVGKLVLIHAYPGYPKNVHEDARTPEERLHRERRELGVDHALVGGVLLRRWGLPASIATTVERHHNAQAVGEAAIVRLADMLAHYERDEPVSLSEMLRCAKAAGLEPAALKRVIYELPGASRQPPSKVDPCPLSEREAAVLRSLAKGNVYKQIAHELGLSTSTIRTHLHNIYGKLSAVDRAQAVLIAVDRGWL